MPTSMYLMMTQERQFISTLLLNLVLLELLHWDKPAQNR